MNKIIIFIEDLESDLMSLHNVFNKENGYILYDTIMNAVNSSSQQQSDNGEKVRDTIFKDLQFLYYKVEKNIENVMSYEKTSIEPCKVSIEKKYGKFSEFVKGIRTDVSSLNAADNDLLFVIDVTLQAGVSNYYVGMQIMYNLKKCFSESKFVWITKNNFTNEVKEKLLALATEKVIVEKPNIKSDNTFRENMQKICAYSESDDIIVKRLFDMQTSYYSMIGDILRIAK